MKHKFSHIPRKRFGQNFLQDPTVIEKILTAVAPQSSNKMIEIGPGLGALTQPLLKVVNHLDVIELDRVLVEQLEMTLGKTNKLTIYSGDALQFDFRTFRNEHSPAKLRIIGNLPYNITTPLIFHLFNFCDVIEDMHFMLQKEVVERLTAQPNNKQYGRLSIMAQYYCQAQYLFTVEANAFYPPPKIQSAFVRLTPHQQLPQLANNLDTLQAITRASFNQRRKTLSNALKPYLDIEDFTKLGINARLRPEALSLAEFVRISNFIDRGKNI
jgi:16S rRNA (adenine1518-N6/adenine1519-N6)-dimethyltransferase